MPKKQTNKTSSTIFGYLINGDEENEFQLHGCLLRPSTTCPATPHPRNQRLPRTWMDSVIRSKTWHTGRILRANPLQPQTNGQQMTPPPSPRDQNTGGFTVPGGSRGFYENPPNAWWLKHRKQAYVKCKWVEHLPQIDTPSQKIGILGRPLEQGKNIYQNTKFGFNMLVFWGVFLG